MTALENQIATTDVVASLDIEMVKNFNGEINRLTEVLGLFAPSIVAAGTTMYTYKVTGELETDTVAEGDEIPLSKYQVAKTPVSTLGIKKYRKLTTAEAILKGGFANAVTKTDSKMIREIRNNILADFFIFLQTGTGTATATGMQATFAQVDATINDKLESNGDSADRIIHFVNPFDIADYLAGAQVTTQTVFGMTYLQSFLGVNDIFQTNKVAKGTMWATPVENIHLYGADFNALADAGLSYTTQDGGLIGVHHEASYDRASAETYVTTGAMMIAENLDYIAKGTIKKGA